MSPVKRICVFEHSVMTNFNCACPAIQRGQGSGFLSEGSSWLTACMSEQWRFWRDCADAQARLNLRCSHRWLVPNSLDAVHVKSEKWHLLLSWQIFWQKVYRNVPLVIFYQIYHFYPNFWICIVCPGNRKAVFAKKILKQHLLRSNN